jgi:hypothetical protein
VSLGHVVGGIHASVNRLSSTDQSEG